MILYNLDIYRKGKYKKEYTFKEEYKDILDYYKQFTITKNTEIIQFSRIK